MDKVMLDYEVNIKIKSIFDIVDKSQMNGDINEFVMEIKKLMLGVKQELIDVFGGDGHDVDHLGNTYDQKIELNVIKEDITVTEINSL